LIDLIGKKISTILGTEYLLTEIAGQGAQGVVYKESSGEFMIKLYFDSTDIQKYSRMEKIKWLQEQNYPDRFIVPLELVEKPYAGYVMRRVKGHFSLNKLLTPSKTMRFSDWYNNFSGGLRRRSYLGYQIAFSFHILHKGNRAYCDISGNNILVAEDKAKASVCLIDIDNLYVPGADSSRILGTARYMAPEIANNQMQPDILTDDYSLAVILFELLRVGHPYIGDKVFNGPPEMETDAYRGFYPYVDDDETGFNSSNQMLPREAVFNTKLKELFKKTFIEGKNNRMCRATAFEYALACLEASNTLIKCERCEAWHYPSIKINDKYFCPWCENENDAPMYLSFRDGFRIGKDNKSNLEHKVISSYILRESENNITENYVLRNVNDQEIRTYFKIIFARDQKKFFLWNPDNNPIWYLKYGTMIPDEIGPQRKQEINRRDIIYFSKPFTMSHVDDNVKGSRILRYAIVM
jgi:DNA-binding helix-hairpin-helix protein with protein kinase domain